MFAIFGLPLLALTIIAFPSAEALDEAMSKSSLSNSVELANGVVYQRMQIDPLATAHVVTIDTTRGAWSIRPYMSDATETTSQAALKTNALLAINAGFFNLSDGESTSYIVLDGKQLCEPKHNSALVNNAGLKPFLTQVFNRSELRFLKDKNGKINMKVQAHFDKVPAEVKLIDSIQAGPQLLPSYTAREEAFVRRAPGATKDSDSIGTNMRAARTAFGITTDGRAIIVCVQGRKTKEFAEGISLPALAEFMRRLGCDTAINFDGGTSTTLVLQVPPEKASRINSLNAVNSSNASTVSTPAETNSSSAPSKSASVSKQLITLVASTPERKVKSMIYVTPAR